MAFQPEKEDSAEKKLMKQAHKHFDRAYEYWNTFYKECQDTLKFIDGDQWDTQLKRNRLAQGLPCLTANQLPTYLNQITNESRQNCPSIQIDPLGDGADQDIAEAYADLIRSIEQASGSDTVYDNAGWYAAAIGLGFFRVVTEFENDTSMHQKLVIKAIQDPQTVLLDPNHLELDGSDSEFCFILSSMTKEDYKRQYADTMMTEQDFKGWPSDFGSNRNKWIEKDNVMIAEYYYKDYTTKTLYQLYSNQNGNLFTSYEKPSKEVLESGNIVIRNQRDVEVCTVKWCKLNGVEVLEETEWPGKCIPVIAVKGDETWINQDRKLRGAVKDAIDSQRVYNYNYSVMAETVSMAPKAPWVITAKQIENYEHLWRDTNNSTLACLVYNDVPGSQPPQRSNSEPAVQAAIAAMNQAGESIKTVFGMFGASIGQAGDNQEAFRTVLARQQASHTTTYHFYDNLAKAVAQCGEILVDVIPTYYADERSVQMIKENGEAYNTEINGDSGRDLTKGNYGVAVETGPSFATRRQDSVSHMIAFQEANPQIQLGDIIASESDWPGAKRIADRIRLMLPPAIQQAEAQDGNLTAEQRAQNATMQLTQMTQQLQQVQQQLQEVMTQHKADAEMIKTQHQEIILVKAESKLGLEKQDKELDIKKKQLVLDELETTLSYKVKLKELELAREQLEIDKGKLALDGVEVAADMNADMHDHTIKHHEAMIKVTSAVPKDATTGQDKDIGGVDVGN